MVRDSVQLETAVNTISHEYLLEFTSKYGISEMLHPELPGPGDRIVDFPEGKVKTGSRPRAPHELPLLTLTAPRVIEMDEPAAATDSSGVPSAIEKSPLDFADEVEASGQETVAPEVPPPEEVPITTVPGGDQAAPVAVEPHVVQESRSSRRGKSLAAMQLYLASNIFMYEGVPADVSDPDPLAFADAPSPHPANVVQSSQGVAVAEDPKSEN
nr:hypothetical protein [Tanacetum cinerariifolium]